MQYLNKTFSLPVSNGRLTEEEYAIRVGLWKPQATEQFCRNLETDKSQSKEEPCR